MLTGMSAPGPEPTGRGEPGAAPTAGPDTPGGTWTARRIVLAVATVVLAVPFLTGLWLVLGSALGSGDPHGYALLGGTFLVLVAGIVLACLVPWLFAPPVRLRAFGLALLGYLVVGVVVGITLANV